MPPHTISPTPDSQGLGISLSTLSPPPIQNGHHSRQPVTFTGIGAMPRSGSQAAMPSHQDGKASAAENSRALPPTSTSGAPLYQPGIALRPTHTRGGSKGFNTFSALPPAQVQPRIQSETKAPAQARTAQQQLPPSVRGFIPSGDQSPDASVESSAFGGGDDDNDTPLRQLGQPSNSTSGSRHSRRNKSVDFLRSLSGKNGQETLGGGAYVPLAGSEEPLGNPLREATVDSREWGGKPQERSDRHSTASSSGATGAVTHNGASICAPAPSDNSHSSLYPKAQLQPRLQPPNLDTRQPPTAALARPAPGPRASGLSRGMSRSKSQPDGLHSVAEGSGKRYSDPSTGTHSKNRVLRDAENGGMMLAFSPGGDYRAGQAIMGSGSALLQTPVSPIAPRRPSAEELHEESLRSRPWSNSTMSDHMRPQTLGHRGRSLSEGAGVLARQGTLFHPGASKQRSSAELSLMLGQPRSRRLSGNRILPPPDLEAWTVAGGSSEEVRLEAAKKKKARVEVDVVLERECVVEGGEIRGRLEITVNGGKRGEGLRVAGGKARVVGFEDVSANSRHIFYHHSHCLPIFDPKGDISTPVPSLFASGPDEEGYRLASEGTHSIPFRMRLPLGGTAKGSFSSPNNRGPCVRYVVVGSVKLFIPSTMKRSIAHFYRPIVVLPYLNPSIVLAPSMDTIENSVERGLGWSLGGEKGKVEVRVSLGRRNWVAGQRAWCEVGIKNNSSRKIKTITLALLQTVQTFHPDSGLNTGDFAARLRRKSANLDLSRDDPGTPEIDACQTSTTRRKLTEEVMEADTTGPGEGRVTGKSWWTGVEAGEKDQWDMSLLIPNGLVTIRRTRLLEVTYMLRVTVNGSIYVDIPINLINFLSIDPPPMPGDAFRTPIPRAVATNVGLTHPPSRLQPTRMASDNSLGSTANPARASSTTLHIDALLQAGRARADAESHAQNQGTENAQSGTQSRPLSIGSEYTLPHARSLADMLALDPPPLPEMGADRRRPPAQTMHSFLSERSDQTHDASMYCDDAEGDARDQYMLETRRKAGRQKSLVLAITRAEQRALEAMEQLELSDHQTNEGYHALSPGKESVQTGEFMPDGTPFEHEVYEIGEMPQVPDLPSDHENGGKRLRVRNHTPELEDYEQDRRSGGQDDSVGMDDQAGLLDLVRDHLPQIRSSSPFDLGMTPKDRESRYDYAPEKTDFNPASPVVDQQDDSMRARYADLDPYSGLSSEQYAIKTRERYGSYAPSEQESEVGQVVDAVKRNLSVRLPARLVPASTGVSEQGSVDSHDQGKQQQQQPQPQQQPQQDQQPAPKASYHLLAAERGDTRPRSPHGLAPPLHPSPLRQVQQLPTEGQSQRKVSRPLPRYPSQRTNDGDRNYDSTDISPRSMPQSQVPSHPIGSVQNRSQLRHQISMGSKIGSAEDEAPGLAPSVASDSASSEGHLESPPGSAVVIASSTLPDAAHATHNMTDTKFGESWTPGQHVLNHEVYLQTGTTESAPHQDAHSTDSHTTSMPGSPQTTESMLPSVRTKIHQLNTRDEALRKFSVSGAISPSTPRASVSSNPRNSINVQRTPPTQTSARHSIISPSIPMVTSPISTTGRYSPDQSPTSPSQIANSTNTTPSKRRSYTTALGPRHARTTSNESTSTSSHGRSPSTHRIGNTTYLTKRSFAQSRHISPTKGTHPSPSIWTQSSGPESPTRSMYRSPYDLPYHDSKGQTALERNMSVSSTSTSATTIEAALMRRPGGPRQPLSPAKKGETRMLGPRTAAARYGRVSEEEDSDGLL